MGDDVVDQWEDYIDLMADSVYKNSGRGCINCSGVWASRHTEEIAEALAEKVGNYDVKDPPDPEAGLAAFPVPNQAEAIWGMIDEGCGEAGTRQARLVQKSKAKSTSGLIPAVIQTSLKLRVGFQHLRGGNWRHTLAPSVPGRS